MMCRDFLLLYSESETYKVCRYLYRLVVSSINLIGFTRHDAADGTGNLNRFEKLSIRKPIRFAGIFTDW